MQAVSNLITRAGYRIGRWVVPLFPRWPGEITFIKLLNMQLSEELDDGLFNFLDNHVLEIVVTDMNICLCIGKCGNRFVCVPAAMSADATISATLGDFLAIASGREDPDALFFQRRLSVRGQTEIGLTVKNRLDAFDRNRIPKWLQQWLEITADALASVN